MALELTILNFAFRPISDDDAGRDEIGMDIDEGDLDEEEDDELKDGGRGGADSDDDDEGGEV